MAEAVINETISYDLESMEIDWSNIVPHEESKGRWSFKVGNRQIGRKIAYEYTKALGSRYIDQARTELENPQPAYNMGLDGGQISFGEYDAELNNKGPINLIEIYIRFGEHMPEYYNRYISALNKVLDKINQAKKGPTNQAG